ncbi:MAG: hypothetical protein IJY79_09045 [Clostridia bacterium]|nr:hypothetical protein [Clostridia bacterium]
MSKKSNKCNVFSLIFGILSCFYAFTFAFSIVLTKIAFLLVPNPEVIQYNSFHFLAIFLILVSSLLSLMFAHFSIKKGTKTKSIVWSRILSIISLAVAVIGTIFVLLLF